MRSSATTGAQGINRRTPVKRSALSPKPPVPPRPLRLQNSPSSHTPHSPGLKLCLVQNQRWRSLIQPLLLVPQKENLVMYLISHFEGGSVLASYMDLQNGSTVNLSTLHTPGQYGLTASTPRKFLFRLSPQKQEHDTDQTQGQRSCLANVWCQHTKPHGM